MKTTKQCTRILISFALLFCMLFGMMSIVDATTYSKTLYPLGSNNRGTLTVSPELHTVKIYISGGKNGSSLKKDSLPSWITVNTSYSDYYLATINPNTSTSVRKGSVLFTKGTNKYELYITQNPFLVKNSSGTVISSLTYKVAGETKTIYTTDTCTCSSSNNDWLTVQTNSGNKSFSIKAKPNPNGSTRSCTLTFTKSLSQYVKVSRTVKVIQSANSITGVPGTRSVSNEKGSFSFTVSTGYGTVKASLSNNYSWLHVSQNGNTVTVSYDANTTLNNTRSGTVLVKIGNITKKCVVTQAKCRSEITFPSTLQMKIVDDDWSNNTRSTYLTKFYDGLIKGANNVSNPAGTRYVVERAKYATVFSWTPNSFAYGYRVDSTDTARDFDAGHKYYGLPYQQTDQDENYTSLYFHYSSVKTQSQFRIKVNDEEFNFGGRRPGVDGSKHSCYSLGPKCGIDCSSFVSYCIGAKKQQSSSTFYDHAGTKYSQLSNTMDIKPGDILWRSGHVLLVASVYREGSTVKGLVLLESRGRTTASGRNLHVFYDSDDALKKMFGNMSISECKGMLQFLILNNTDTYKNIGTVSDFVNSFNAKHTLLKVKSLNGIELEDSEKFKYW